MTQQEKTCASHKAFITLGAATGAVYGMRGRLLKKNPTSKNAKRLNVFPCPANSLVDRPHYHIGRIAPWQVRTDIKELRAAAQAAARAAEKAFLEACDAKAALEHAENIAAAKAMTDRLLAGGTNGR